MCDYLTLGSQGTPQRACAHTPTLIEVGACIAYVARDSWSYSFREEGFLCMCVAFWWVGSGVCLIL